MGRNGERTKTKISRFVILNTVKYLSYNIVIIFEIIRFAQDDKKHR